MKPADDRVLKEAANLSDGPLYEHLALCRQDALERLAHAEQDDFRRIQGEAAVFLQLMKLIENARSDLRMRQHKPDMRGAF